MQRFVLTKKGPIPSLNSPQLRGAGVPLRTFTRYPFRWYDHDFEIETGGRLGPTHWSVSWIQAGGPHTSRFEALGRAEAPRWFSGGKQKGGESAKEKKLRRLLKKLNPSEVNEADETEETEGASDRHQHRRKGGEREGAGLRLAQFEDAATEAQQQMEKSLQQLTCRLKEMQVARPQIEIFEKIQVHIGSTVH